MSIGVFGKAREHTMRIRLLLEADVPVTDLVSIEKAEPDEASRLRALVIGMLGKYGATVREADEAPVGEDGRVVLALPDGTDVKVARAGRPPEALRKWLLQGYVPDWRSRQLVKPEATDGGTGFRVVMRGPIVAAEAPPQKPDDAGPLSLGFKDAS